jgi:hypothetical protein
MPPAAEDAARLSPPPSDTRPQPAKENPSTSDWSQADTVAPGQEGPRSRETFITMRIGIRIQLGLLVLIAALLGLAVVTIATWVRQPLHSIHVQRCALQR